LFLAAKIQKKVEIAKTFATTVSFNREPEQKVEELKWILE
jgi:hypothetical protein